MIIRPVTGCPKVEREVAHLPTDLPNVDGRSGRDVNVVSRARCHLFVNDGAVVLPLLQLDYLLLESAVLLLQIM